MNHRPLRILIDARALLGRFSGVARFVTALVDELARSDDLKILTLCGSEPYGPWRDRNDIQMLTSSFTRSDRTPKRRCLWEEHRLANFIRDARVDLFHATWNSGVPIHSSTPIVLTLHDLIPWHSSATGFRQRCARSWYRRSVKGSAHRATMITCVSDHVRSQVESVLAVAGSKVITVANGVTMLELRHEDRHRDGSRYVLYVGGHEPRKNIEALFSSMAIYWQRYEPTLELRLTGFRETLSREASLSFDRLEGPVRFLGQIDEVELSRQYAGAMAMLMLSKDEGFGLPVLEAMAHGCPVIAARAASLPEVVGDAGLLVDSANSGEVARALNRIVQDEAVRLQLIERGLGRAALFSWRHTADRMRDVYVRTVDVPGWRAARSTPEGESISKPPAWSPQIAIRA